MKNAEEIAQSSAFFNIKYVILLKDIASGRCERSEESHIHDME
jgi:hypothetical protein